MTARLFFACMNPSGSATRSYTEHATRKNGDPIKKSRSNFRFKKQIACVSYMLKSLSYEPDLPGRDVNRNYGRGLARAKKKRISRLDLFEITRSVMSEINLSSCLFFFLIVKRPV